MINEIEHDYLTIKNNLSPQSGRLLISEPFSGDHFFSRTVVLLTEHNQNGSVGFILNKPIKESLGDVVHDFEGFNSIISVGGPVATDSVFYIHKLDKKLKGSQHIHGNLYWGGDIELLKLMIKNNKVSANKIRFFVGYSGWSPKQLDSELKNNFWVVSDFVPKNLLFNHSPQMWNLVISALGDDFKVWANTPENPSLN